MRTRRRRAHRHPESTNQSSHTESSTTYRRMHTSTSNRWALREAGLAGKTTVRADEQETSSGQGRTRPDARCELRSWSWSWYLEHDLEAGWLVAWYMYGIQGGSVCRSSTFTSTHRASQIAGGQARRGQPRRAEILLEQGVRRRVDREAEGRRGDCTLGSHTGTLDPTPN